MKRSPKVSVIIPMFNEEDSVVPMHNAVATHVERMNVPYEIVFVDDGSRDGTLDRLEKLAQSDPHVVVLKLRSNSGQTAAMAAGIEFARGAYLVTLDGDLQNDPADIPMMIEKMDEGYDLVVGWRINRQDKWLSRKLPSRVANWIIGKVTGLPIRDNGCSLKVYRADIIKRVPLYSDMHRFIPAMTIPLGARVAQVGVRHHSRQFGQSKYGLSRIYKVVLDLIGIKTILTFSRHPITRFTLLGALFALFALVSSVALLWLAAEGSSVVVGTIVAMLFGSLAIFLTLLGFAVALVHKANGTHISARFGTKSKRVNPTTSDLAGQN